VIKKSPFIKYDREIIYHHDGENYAIGNLNRLYQFAL